jgi:hypothetical protein
MVTRAGRAATPLAASRQLTIRSTHTSSAAAVFVERARGGERALVPRWMFARRALEAVDESLRRRAAQQVVDSVGVRVALAVGQGSK